MWPKSRKSSPRGPVTVTLRDLISQVTALKRYKEEKEAFEYNDSRKMMNET